MAAIAALPLTSALTITPVAIATTPALLIVTSQDTATLSKSVPSATKI